MDTSAWIGHQRVADARIDEILRRGGAVSHSAVVGELSLGCGSAARVVAEAVSRLARVDEPDAEAVRAFAASHDVACKGIGWTDACLLAATALSGKVRLLTIDRALAREAARLGLAWAG